MIFTFIVNFKYLMSTFSKVFDSTTRIKYDFNLIVNTKRHIEIY